jgi:predicted neutral ceramidase superfamily lipid hydrolase
MIRQERKIVLAILIPLLYATGIWFETGFFLIPTPLLDVIFAVTTLSFAINLFESRKYIALISIAYAVSKALTQPWLWSFIISDQHMEDFVNQGNLELFKLIAGVFYMVWGGLTLIRRESKERIVLFLLFVGIFSAAFIFQWYSLFLVSTMLPYISSFRYKDLHPFHLIWLLLTLFEWMKWAMLQWTT